MSLIDVMYTTLFGFKMKMQVMFENLVAFCLPSIFCIVFMFVFYFYFEKV